ILAPLKTFAPWGHTHQPCPLGHLIAALTRSALGTGLEVDRALPAAARRRLLAAAAMLLGRDARDDAATEALRRVVRGTSASGGGGEGRDTSPHMALDMANHLHYWCGAWLHAGDRLWVFREISVDRPSTAHLKTLRERRRRIVRVDVVSRAW